MVRGYGRSKFPFKAVFDEWTPERARTDIHLRSYCLSPASSLPLSV